VQAYADWMSTNDVAKLFVNADPGVILVGEQREFCRRRPRPVCMSWTKILPPLAWTASVPRLRTVAMTTGHLMRTTTFPLARPCAR